MYAPKGQNSIRLAMASLSGETGKKVFDAIQATNGNDRSRKAAAEARKRIEAARQRKECGTWQD